MGEIKNYKDLEVWKLSRVLVKKIFQACSQFPRETRYELVSQMYKSVVSISSNIAEGHGRPGRKDFANFVSIALGSAAELETQVILSQDLEFLPESKASEILAIIERVQQMLHKLYQALQK